MHYILSMCVECCIYLANELLAPETNLHSVHRDVVTCSELLL